MSHHAGEVPAHCVNCEHALHPSYNFCPACGQKSYVHRLTLHDIFHDAFHYFVHVDKGFLQLLIALAVKTGVVAKEYVSGKRKKYFPPLNFFLIAVALYVFAVNIYSHHAAAPKENWRENVKRIPDPIARKYFTRIYERQEFIVPAIEKYSNFIYMVSTPLFAFIIWMFYYKARYNYTEHLIANMYITGVCTMLYATVIVPLSLIPWIAKYKADLLIYGIFEISYLAIFYNRFMDNRKGWAKLKSWAVAVFIIGSWTVWSISFVYWYIRNGLFGLFP